MHSNIYVNNSNGGGSLAAELLWTNENPSSAFAEQTIELDLSSYKKIIISLMSSANSTVYTHIEAYKNVYCGTTFYSNIRSCHFTNDSVFISNCINDSGTQKNNMLVPRYIYGLK